MPLTKSFNETIKARLQESASFRKALLREAVGCMVAGDVETGKSLLRKYINGTVGFIQLGADLDRSPKVLMRMFGPTGNPQARNLFEIVAYLQKIEGTVLEVVDRTAASAGEPAMSRRVVSHPIISAGPKVTFRQ